MTVWLLSIGTMMGILARGHRIKKGSGGNRGGQPDRPYKSCTTGWVQMALSGERPYKPAMNPCVSSGRSRARLRLPYTTHVFLAYTAVSEHLKLTHCLHVGVLSALPQELFTRAPFPMRPPKLFKMTWVILRKKMTKNYPHEFQQLGVVVLAAGQETAYAAAASVARAGGQPR